MIGEGCGLGSEGELEEELTYGDFSRAVHAGIVQRYRLTAACRICDLHRVITEHVTQPLGAHEATDLDVLLLERSHLQLLWVALHGMEYVEIIMCCTLVMKG